MSMLERFPIALLYAVLLWAPLAAGGYWTWPVEVAELLTLLAVVFWVVGMARRGRLEWRRTALDLPVALLVGLLLVQLVLGNRPLARWALAPPTERSDLPTPFFSLGTVSPERTLAGLLTVLMCAGVYLLVVNLIRRRRQLDRLIQTLLLTGGVLAFLGLLDHFAGTAWLIRWRLEELPKRLSGPFANPDHFAPWLGMLVCLGLGYLRARTDASGPASGILSLVRSREGREEAIRRYFPALAIVVMALALVLTLSRGGVVSFLAGLAVFLGLLAALGRARGTFVAVGLVLAATLAYAAWIGLGPLLQRVWQAGYADRWLIFLTSVPMLAAAPLTGVGLGAYSDFYPRYQPTAIDPATVFVNEAHSDLLQLAIELGLVGVALSLWAAWRVGRDLLGAHLFGRNACPVGREPDASVYRNERFSVGVAIGAISAVALLLAHSALDFPTRIPANAILAAACLGIAVVALHTRFGTAERRELAEVRRVELGPRRWSGMVAGAFAVVVVLLFGFVILREPVVLTMVYAVNRGGPPHWLETALRIDPSNRRALETRGRRRLEAAQRAWESGLTGEGPPLLTWEERRQVTVPLASGAIGDLRRALAQAPARASLHERLALAHWVAAVAEASQRPEHAASAVAHLERAIMLVPADVRRYRALALFAIPLGGPFTERGLHAARTAIQRDPELLPDLVDELLPAGLSEDQWLALVPATAIDQLRLGLALEKLGLLDLALPIYRRVVQAATGGEAVLARWMLAVALTKRGDARGALAELQVALRGEPGNAELYLARGRALARLGDADALEAFRTAVQRAASPSASAFAVTGARLQALVTERVGSPAGPVRYRRALAQHLTDRELWAQAREEWEIVVRELPEDAAVHFGRGVTFDGLGVRDQALAAYQRAVSLDGSAAAYRLRLAERLWQAEQFVQAMNEWRSIIAQHPGNLEARLALAAAYIRAGERPQAVAEYRHILQIAPDNALARQELARLGARSTP
jgi:tetratricopeptide (TPR) repeat protein